MTLNTQTRSAEQISPAYSPQTQSWKWEKRHALLLIAAACFALWFFSSQIKEASWMPTVNKWLPWFGGLAFASETILKLAQ